MHDEDELAIRALYAAYNRAIDAGDAIAWADTFVENGVFHHPAHSWAGQEQLRQFVNERTSGFGSHPIKNQRHWNDGLTIAIDQDQATGSCDLLVAGLSRTDATPKIAALGRYEDVLERTASGWRFVERRLTVT